MSFAEGYLCDPQSLPGTRFQPPCGDVEIAIAAAGGPYRCQGLSLEQAQLLQRRYEAAEAPATASVTVEILSAPQSDFRSRDQMSWEYSFDVEPRPDEVLLAGWDFAARIQLQPEFAATIWTPHLAGEVFELAFTNVFRVIVAYRLVERGGVMLHSAVASENNSALLFVGVSGAGKSTVAQLALASGRTVLSDDLNGIEMDGERAVAEWVPFTGDLPDDPPETPRFPLARILRLNQGDTPELRPLSSAETVALLLGCAPFVNTDPWRRERLLANIEACSRDLPADELTFARDGGFWHLISSEKAP